MGCFTVLRSKKKKSCPIVRNPSCSREISPTKLPEPESIRPSLQSAPPSFKTRTKSSQPTTRITNRRTRTLSAPSTLDVSDEDQLTVTSTDFEESKSRGGGGGGMGKDPRFPNPQALPLPSPQTGPSLKNLGSFKMSNSSATASSGPLPLPPFGTLRSYSYKEISTACQHFSIGSFVSDGLSSMVYKASFGDDTMNNKLEANVTLLPSSQGFKAFVNEMNMIASLQHPQLCKLLGFHAREGSDQRMLVYERLLNGSLDQLLYGKSSSPPIDWASRMKVATCAARGLAFLHEEGPFQAMYNEFSAANVQIDKDFSAKLSGYGCVSSNLEVEIPNNSTAYLSVETIERGILTPKSNVWSFGILFLELLTGRKNLDPKFPREERNLVKWSKPYLSDDLRLSLIMDSRLKGRYPPKAVRTVADIALKCLQKDPSERPTMRNIVDSLESIQDIKYSCRFPLLEPSCSGSASNGSKQMARSPSLDDGIIFQTSSITRGSFSPSPSMKNRSSVYIPHISPPRLSSTSSLSVSLPLRTCASTISLANDDISTVRASPSAPSAPPPPNTFSRASVSSVEGF